MQINYFEHIQQIRFSIPKQRPNPKRNATLIVILCYSPREMFYNLLISYYLRKIAHP